MDLSEGTESIVRRYLDYFLGLETAPGFAFLINGKWGAGKTHFIKNYCAAKRRRVIQENVTNLVPLQKAGAVYVSLNGIEAVEQIDLAIAQERIPGFSNKYLGIFSRFGVGVVKAAIPGGSAIDGAELASLLPDLKSRLVLFDDFERCRVDSDVLLGYINFLVEHSECWVVILANEEKIEGEFSEIKEKVVGHSMTLQPHFEAPFEAFCEKRLKPEVQQFIRSKRDVVQRIFGQSDTDNLRILEQSVMVVEQIFEPIKEWLERSDFIDHFLTLILSLCFDVKSGRLSRSDLDFDRLLLGGASDEGVKPSLKTTAERYGLQFLADSVLSSALWQQILFDGVVDEGKLKDEAGRSIHLQRPEDQPSWRIAWHYLILDTDVVKSAIATMKEEFKSRKWLTTAEFLHVVGIFLRLHRDGVIEDSPEDIEMASLAYIHDLASDNKDFDLALVEVGSDPINFNGTGLGMMETDSSTFQSVRSELEKMQLKSLEASLQEKADLVRDSIESRPDIVQSIVREGATEYEHREFLHFIDVEDAVTAFSSAPGGFFQDLVSAFSRRSELARTLKNAQEAEWFRNLSAALKAKADHLEPLDAARIGWLAARIRPRDA